jgi:hypothetical protein
MSNISKNGDHNLVNYYQNLLNEQDKQHQKEMKSTQKNASERIEKASKINQEKLIERESKFKDTVEKMQNNKIQDLTFEKDTLNKELQHAKSVNYNGKGKIPLVPEQNLKDLALSMQKLHEGLRKNDLESFDRLENEKNENIKALIDKHDYNTTKMQDSFKQDMSNMAQDIQEREKIAFKNVNESRHEKSRAIEQKNSETQEEVKRLLSGFQNKERQLKRTLDNSEKYHANRQQALLSEQYKKTDELLNREQMNSQSNIREAQKSYEKQIQQLNDTMKHDKKANENQLSMVNDKLSEEKANALNQQAARATEYLQTKHKDFEKEKEQLNTALKEKKNDRLTEANAALEHQIRSKLSQNHQKELSLETQRNKEQVNALERKFKEPIHELQRTMEAKESKLQAQSAAERIMSNNRLLEVLTEADFKVKEQQREQEFTSSKQRDHLIRNFERALERQRHDYTNMIENLKENAQSRINELQKNSELFTKEMQRNLQQKNNEMVRDYERRLDDQKNKFEGTVEDLKLKNFDELQDMDRKSKQELEKTIKNYEQRLAQVEAHYKNREDQISKGFQQELERATRAYAFSKKKS